MQPYRPEDQPQVEAMYERAAVAEQLADGCWIPVAPASDAAVADELDALWVAVRGGGPSDAVGAVGVERFNGRGVLAPDHPLARAWLAGEVAELRRVRVDPSVRRRGIGMRLCRTVLRWCRRQGYAAVVVNTTSPQRPARALYAKLGFREVGVTFVGRYELVWMQLDLEDRA